MTYESPIDQGDSRSYSLTVLLGSHRVKGHEEAERLSRPVMAAGMMTRECVGREIIRAGVAVAAVGDAGTGRRTRALQRGPVGRSLGTRRWPASI
jgi:hypothetical protein